MFTRGPRLASIALALLLAAPGSRAFAQGSQTSAINGAVRDNGGLVLPGVTVTATSPAIQGVRTTTTDANGNYVLRGLLPGAYTISFELAGFQTGEKTADLQLGLTSEVNAELQVAGVTDTVTVVAEAPTQLTTTTGGANYKIRRGQLAGDAPHARRDRRARRPISPTTRSIPDS